MAMLHELSLNQVVWVDPERMSGMPCFTGTRVPVQALLDHLEAGVTLDEFLEGFPTVSREQAVAFLELAKDQLVRCVSS
ncbi:DUF433 domain-containing protein [Methylacidiphilales bacterium]|nr:DUF433 domain-containing protein [Candidatus Methylacidiphilales bacterium]